MAPEKATHYLRDTLQRTPIRVLIADDHGVVRAGLRLFLSGTADLEVVGEASTGQEAIAQAEALHPEVILMDLVMGEVDGIEATRQIKQRHPDIAVVALTSFVDESKVTEAIQAGAIGYLLKDARPAEVVETIRAARQGEVRLHPEALKRLTRAMTASQTHESGLELLTQREREVLALVARGQSNKEIARSLMISETTVKHHLGSILSKLGLTSRTQAALYGVRHGLAE
jgi:DNA-binding NarL/FixJ family response regulator